MGIIAIPELNFRIGRAVEHWRCHFGFTQRQLAERVKVSQGTVAQIEQGQSLRIKTLELLARELGFEQLSKLIEFAEYLGPNQVDKDDAYM